MFGRKRKIEMFRQGDVLIERISAAGKTDVSTAKHAPTDGHRVVLAYGEATGHAHAITLKRADDAVLFDNGRGVRILRVNTETEMRHEEHAPIALAPGDYRVTIQREWDDVQERYVAD